MRNRVLFVSTVDPFGMGGGPQATRAFMDATIDIFGISNVSIMIPEEVTIPPEYKDCNYIRVPRRGRLTGLIEMLRGLTGRFSKPVVDIIKHSPDSFNLCIFNCGRESGWSFKKIRKLNIKKITIHHNQEVEYCMDNKTMYTFGGKFPYIVKHEEKNAYIYSDINLFLTQQDKDAFSRSYGQTKAINELLGTFDYKSSKIISAMDDSKKIYDLVASGSLSQYQTVHGILDFCNNYLDVSKELIPNLKILLTGRSPRKEIVILQKKNTDVIDIVPSPIDIQREVSKGKIFLCPTDIGGGLKLRAMDGLKNGLPVLIHEISSRGYDYFFNKSYFRKYNNKETFAKGLIDILNYLQENPSCAETINNDYYEYFGYQKGLERFKKVINYSSNREG